MKKTFFVMALLVAAGLTVANAAAVVNNNLVATSKSAFATPVAPTNLVALPTGCTEITINWMDKSTNGNRF